ncbi:uncharacterized protein TEOVI_000765600 [Trypanosoma equiperdum]|uniref:Uncharacterized protein n=3 Tax=Trypanozoon TaxID=39700 RepID=Q38EP3_TRYB2|nr:hypothetical protein, unlikely [Trypanosoma brucei brucei TREU927]EAN76727.1 hypothetical protein, unlikely [Trypanosoma brucei brucei TREU927]SCU64953.1 hypothetical protein, conserved [Trypanosoma equiperdum]
MLLLTFFSSCVNNAFKLTSVRLLVAVHFYPFRFWSCWWVLFEQLSGNAPCRNFVVILCAKQAPLNSFNVNMASFSYSLCPLAACLFFFCCSVFRYPFDAFHFIEQVAFSVCFHFHFERRTIVFYFSLGTCFLGVCCYTLPYLF